MDKLLFYIATAMVVINAVLSFLLLLKKQLGGYMYPVVLILLAHLIHEILSYYFKHSFLLFFIFNPIEYACYAWFIYLNVTLQKFKTIILGSIYMSFILVCLLIYPFIKLNTQTATNWLNYEAIVKGILLIIASAVYFRNIFLQIGLHKKLNVFVLSIVVGMLFYFSFYTIYNISYYYLANYSTNYAMQFKLQNGFEVYATKRLSPFKPLVFLTSILLYSCIFVALIKSASLSKKASII